VSFLKLILDKASASTRTTAFVIRKKFAKLDTYIIDIASENIKAFNTYVKGENKKLKAMGERSTDLLEHFFEAYLTVSDKNFTSYVQQLRTDYDTGKEDIAIELLLCRGESHY